ncbi:hypothetical protein Tco_0117868 [Tanacetum coccineum]
MTTLAEFMIIADADNRPPMLEKSMYDSWKSRMELYIKNKENGRMILNFVLNGPLVLPTVAQEDGTTRTKKYEELLVSEKLQVNCDLKATNIGLQGLPPDVYAISNHHKVAKEIWDRNEDLDAYDFDCDDVSNAKAVLMANLSNYDSYVILMVPHSESYHNDLDNQSVHAIHDFKQTPVVDFSDNEITCDSNIISYSQYLQETQQAAVQDTNLYAQQDSMILSVIEQMSEQMINHVNKWEKANQEKNNESLITELERYKERVKTFEQRLNIDLSTCEKMIDSQMDDMIKEKLALKQQIDSLEQKHSNQIK